MYVGNDLIFNKEGILYNIVEVYIGNNLMFI